MPDERPKPSPDPGPGSQPQPQPPPPEPVFKPGGTEGVPFGDRPTGDGIYLGDD